MTARLMKPHVTARVVTGMAFTALFSIALVGATSAQDNKQDVAGVQLMRFPDEESLSADASVQNSSAAKIVNSGAIVAHLNCDPWPDYVWVKADGMSLVMQPGAKAIEKAPAQIEVKLPGTARFVVIADFVPGQCQEIAVATDGKGQAARQAQWYRWDGSTLALLTTIDLPGSPRAAAVADMNLLSVNVSGVDVFPPEFILAAKNADEPKICVFGSLALNGAPVMLGTPITIMSTDDDPTSIDPADIDDDKDLDLDVRARATLPSGGMQLRQVLVNKRNPPSGTYGLDACVSVTLPAP